MSRASGLAGFSTSISPPSNLNVGVVTATSLTVGGVTVSSAGVAVFSGNVGIGTTTSPTTALDVNGDVTIADKIIHGGDTNTAIRFPAADTFTVETAGVEAMRIDSSARLLVGTSTARNIGVGFQAAIGSQLFIEQTSAGITPATFALNRNDTNGPRVVLGKSRGTALGSNTIVQSGDELGRFDFAGADGTDLETVAAEIKAVVDGAVGINSMPGRLVFSTTAIGASSPTERMRIDSTGKVAIGVSPGSAIQFTVDGNIPDDGQVYAIGIRCSAIANATTSNIYGFISDIEPTVGTVNTVTGLYRYFARRLNSFGSATVTNQYGFAADSSLTGATNNYGFFSSINDATGRWNFYAAGTANNYFAGKVGIGTTSPATTLDVDGDVTITDKIIHAGNTNTAIRFPEADNFTVETGGTERMRITSDGRLVMGGITPATGTNHSICTPGRLQSDGTYSITTAGSANVAVQSSGLFARSTSSIKYKTEVEDAELSYSEALVYGSRPVWYRSLSESDPSDYSYWGFIAEEVAEIDPRMVHWGDDGPEGVQYDRYVVHLVSVIQKQQQRLDVLEARIAALEA